MITVTFEAFVNGAKPVSVTIPEKKDEHFTNTKGRALKKLAKSNPGKELNGLYFSSVNCSGLSLSNLVFNNCKFYNCDFEKTNLENTFFYNCLINFCFFHNAVLTDVSFHASSLNGNFGIIDGGSDQRGYRFFGWMGKKKRLMINAGCRCFPENEALDHWRRRHQDDPGLAADCLGRVKLIASLAPLVDWTDR